MSAATGRCGYCDLPMEECRRLTDLRQHQEEAAAAWRGRGITFDPRVAAAKSNTATPPRA